MLPSRVGSSRRLNVGNLAPAIENSSVVVAIKAERSISKDPLSWALTHVARPGDCVSLLAVFPDKTSGKDISTAIYALSELWWSNYWIELKLITIVRIWSSFLSVVLINGSNMLKWAEIRKLLNNLIEFVVIWGVYRSEILEFSSYHWKLRRRRWIKPAGKYLWDFWIMFSDDSSVSKSNPGN